MLTCPSCAYENPESNRFCGECGARLAPSYAAEAEERKIVTVLFCDLVGFTAASDRADPEDVLARIRPYHTLLRAEIERFGGTVEKFIGDAVMAVFGAPVAHEDDPERAVRSGLRILESVAELNSADSGLELQVRIGINTGEAVVALDARPERGEGIVTGDVVNTASRLQSAAPVGGIAVGEQTYRATEQVFDFEAMEAVAVKGKAEPIHLWRAIASRARFGTDLTRVHATSLVGRQIDLGILSGAFQKSLQESIVQLVTIVGEPGVGKSRLVAELFSVIDAMPDLLIRWRQGRCLPYGDTVTFWALGEILKAEAGILETDVPEAAASKIDALVPQNGADAAWLRQRLRPLIGLEVTPAARDENFAAWRGFLESLAEDRPSVFVFEDLHWADDALLAFLEHLADYAEGVPMLLVATARPELFEKAPGFAQAARNSTRINLSPLSEMETAKLVSNLLEQAVLPVEVQSTILARSGGNPLYAEEFVRLLKDRSLLVRKGATYELAEMAEIPFPEGIQALIAARLDTLSPERKAMLQDAAVVGKLFWAGAVAAMGDLEPQAVKEALHELSRKQLVRPARTSSMEGESEYSFWHILVRDVAYSQIPRIQRSGRHQRAAAWIEEVAGERVEDHAEILAYHYTQALDLARAAGRAMDTAALEAPALRFILLAGDRALGLDTAKAEAQFAKALVLAPPGHPERPTVLARWGDAARQAGRHAEAAGALEEAVALFKDQGRRVEAARALTTLANVLWFRGDARNREIAAEAVALLESEPPGPELVEAYAEAGRLDTLAGDHRQGIGWAERALALASDLGLGEPAKALGYRGESRGDLGDPAGLEDLRRALALAVERGQGLEAAVLYNNNSTLVELMEGPAAALAILREGIDFCERRGISQPLLFSSAGELDLEFAMGSWDEILGSADDLAARLGATGSVTTLMLVRQAQVQLLVHRGRAQEALPLAEWAAQAARESGQTQQVAVTFAAAAMARLATGDREGAKGLLREVDETPHVREVAPFVRILPELVRTAVAAGDVVLAERLASGLEPIYPYREHALCTTRAILSEARGERDEATRLYAEAGERWKRFGMAPEYAFALLGQGRCLVILGRAAEAAGPLKEAREIFARLGARPALTETDAVMGQAIALTS